MQQNFQLQEPDDPREIVLEIVTISGLELAASHKSSKGKMDQCKQRKNLDEILSHSEEYYAAYGKRIFMKFSHCGEECYAVDGDCFLMRHAASP
jgi:hypothetical protein